MEQLIKIKKNNEFDLKYEMEVRYVKVMVIRATRR